MINYMDSNGNIATVTKQISEQVTFKIEGDDLERTWYWDDFIKRFGTIARASNEK